MSEPPYIGWFVVEVDVDRERDHPLFCHVRGPFPTEERAERERDSQQEAWEQALAEWDDGNPYDFKGWDIVEKQLPDFYLDRLERMDQDRHDTMTAAADAVAGSMLADEGIGPYAGGDDE